LGPLLDFFLHEAPKIAEDYKSFMDGHPLPPRTKQALPVDLKKQSDGSFAVEGKPNDIPADNSRSTLF